MKRLSTLFLTLSATIVALAQGWPAQYDGVMLQGFYWDSYSDSRWTKLEGQADELAEFFNLVWLPQSAKAKANPSMGYDPLYWFNDYNSSFGNEEQLRSLINTFKQKGIGTIADVVINHRETATTWNDFVSETYKGETYQLTYNDICSDDECVAAGYKAGPNRDTGEAWPGMRDLDHKSQNVQRCVAAYLDMLLNDMGYAGFRYDMVKGFSPSFVGQYNQKAAPRYSVGECWDSYDVIRNWIDGTKVSGTPQSAAFDFTLKYLLRDACNSGSGWKNELTKQSLAMNPDYSRWAITFVDNHDTYGRGNDSETKNNILAANAFILAAPGTPCLFLPHWRDYKNDLKQMIYARKLAGIHNQSSTENISGVAYDYALEVNGKGSHSVVVSLGRYRYADDNYFTVSTGQNYVMLISKDVESAWTDQPSQTFTDPITVSLQAISKDASAQLVYTTDGSAPTATNGLRAANDTKITISDNTTLRVALLSGSTVKGEITRHYTKDNSADNVYKQITVYVKKNQWANMNYYTWGDYRQGMSWPGEKVTATTDQGGATWYYKTYQLMSKDDYVNFVFSNNGSPQTVDINNITDNAWFEISSSTDGSGKYKVNDLTQAMSVSAPKQQQDNTSAPVYNLLGQPLAKPAKGINIIGGKKVVGTR